MPRFQQSIISAGIVFLFLPHLGLAQPDTRVRRGVYPLERQSAQNLATLLKNYLQDDAQVTADPISNCLLVSGPQAVHEELKLILERLDRPSADVQVDCWLVDLVESGAGNAGEVGDQAFQGGVGHVLSYIGVLEKKGIVKNVQHLRLRTMALRPGFAMVGQEITLVSSVRVMAAGNVQRTLERRQVGTIFRATPTLESSGKILVDWTVERSSAQENPDGPVLGNDELGRPIRKPNIVVSRGQGKATLVPGRMQPLQGIETSGGAGRSRTLVLLAAVLPNESK